MKILLLNQAFVSPDEPGHTRHFEMAKFLQTHGHELVIVASDLNYQTGKRTVEHSGIYAEQRRFFDEEGAFRETCRETEKPCLADCAPLAARCSSGSCTVVATGAPPVRDAGAPDAARADAGADAGGD